ncbi:hypothetical protein WAI453_004971 [Rhynchosporium graminicola]
MAFKAGTDCVIVCHTKSAQVGAIKLVIEAIKSGELSQDDIQASVARIEALKSKFVTNFAIPISTLQDQNAKERKVRHCSLSTETYAKSTTVVRSVTGSFPINIGSTKRIVFISPGTNPTGSGAVGSGDRNTRDPHTPSTYVDLL